VRHAALAAVLVLAACSGPSGPQPAELTRLERPRDVKVLWSSNVGPADRFTFAPALAGGSVYAAAREGTVTALDAAKGATRWRAALELKLSGGVGADARTVAVASEEGEVVALEADNGKVRWRARVSSEVLAPPTLGAGLVLVRTLDNRVFAFDAADGKRRWVYQRAPTALVVRMPAGVTIAGDLAFAGFPGGKLAALSLANGAVRWEGTVAAPKGATELERVTDVMGDPAVQGREVCAAAYRGRVSCFDAASGRQLWARDLASLSAVTLDARYAFVADERGAVHALDRSNGQSVWKQDRLAHRGLSAPLPGAAAVAVGDFEGYVHFLSRESGALVARRETGGGAIRAAPVVLPAASASGLLVQTEGGGLFALAL
jgi:outer membrane protein assembly factor BamB